MTTTEAENVARTRFLCPIKSAAQPVTHEPGKKKKKKEKQTRPRVIYWNRNIKGKREKNEWNRPKIMTIIVIITPHSYTGNNYCQKQKD